MQVRSTILKAADVIGSVLAGIYGIFLFAVAVFCGIVIMVFHRDDYNGEVEE